MLSEEESPRFCAVLRIMLAMEFSGSIISPSLKSQVFTEQAIKRALKALLELHKGNWSVIQAKGYQAVVDHILQEADQQRHQEHEHLPSSSKQQQELNIVANWHQERETAALPECCDREKQAPAVPQCHVTVEEQEKATREERPCAFSGSMSGMPLNMPLVRDSQTRQLVSGSQSWSIVVAGISKGSIKAEELKDLAERVLCNFEFVPDCSRFLSQVEMYCELEEDDCAVMGFSSEAVAELFLDACSDDAQFPFEIDGKKLTLARNYHSPRMGVDKENLIKALRTSSLVARRIVCVSGVPEEWADQSRLKRHFEKIVRGSDDFQFEEVIKSVHVQPCLSVAYLELASDFMVDTLFYRCSKDVRLLQDVAKDLFICRSSKCIPMLHFSRHAVYPVPAREGNEAPAATGIKVKIGTNSQYPVASGSKAVNVHSAPAGSQVETRASSGTEVQVPQTKLQSARREIEDPHKAQCTAATNSRNVSESQVKVPQTSFQSAAASESKTIELVASGIEVEGPQTNAKSDVASRREVGIPSQFPAATEIKVEIRRHAVAGSKVETPRKSSAASGSKVKISEDIFQSVLTSQNAVEISQSSSQPAAAAQLDVEIHTNSQYTAKVENANVLGQAQEIKSEVDTKRLSSARTQQNCAQIDTNQKTGAQTQSNFEIRTDSRHADAGSKVDSRKSPAASGSKVKISEDIFQTSQNAVEISQSSSQPAATALEIHTNSQYAAKVENANVLGQSQENKSEVDTKRLSSGRTQQNCAKIDTIQKTGAQTQSNCEIRTDSRHAVGGSKAESPRKSPAASGCDLKISEDSVVEISQSSSHPAATAQLEVEIHTNFQYAAKVENANVLGQAQENKSVVDTKRLSSARTQQKIDTNQKTGAQTQSNCEVPQRRRFKRDTCQVHNASASIARSNSQNSTNGQSDVLDQAPENNSQVQSNSPSSVNVRGGLLYGKPVRDRIPEIDAHQTKFSRSSARDIRLPQSKRKRLGCQSSQVHSGGPSRETVAFGPSRNLSSMTKVSMNVQRCLFIASLLPGAHDPRRLKDLLCNLLMRVMPHEMAADGIKNIHWTPGKSSAHVEFRSEATADALMDAYIKHTQDLCVDDFPLCIYRHAEYVRPGAVMQGTPVASLTRKASVTIVGIPGGLHPLPLKGALTELLERVLAANSFLSIHPKNLLRCFFFNNGDSTAFAMFGCASALEFLLSLKSPFALAGGKIVLLRASRDAGLFHPRMSVHDRLGPRGSGDDHSSGDEAGYYDQVDKNKRKNFESQMNTHSRKHLKFSSYQ